jgi:hypothetical protein
MRWWDDGVRVRVLLLALVTGALGWAAGPPFFGPAGASALLLLLLVLRSTGLRRDRGPWRLDGTPRRADGLLIGRGFEWDAGVLQEQIDDGREPARAERELVLPDALLGQHALILGSTGTGKSRLLELLALQAAARGDAVVVVDPKGDAGLERRLRETAGGRFRLVSLPHPERGVPYNPLGCRRDARDVADRVAALLPGAGDALPFRNFGWEIVHTAAKALDGREPLTFRTLKRATIDRPVRPLSERPRDYYLKTASALIPALSKLAIDVLCPAEGGLSWRELDRERQVALLSLGSLQGHESASAVAKAALLDLQAYVGARYAEGAAPRPLWLFIDELGDVATEAFIHLLNKSRGAGMRIVACAQTASDLEAALGDRARALQVLGNVNTVVQFRAPSGPDAEVFSRFTGERLVKLRSESETYEPAIFGSGFRQVDDFRARFGESRSLQALPLVPAWAVVRLPVFHFFARWEGLAYRGRVPLPP